MEVVLRCIHFDFALFYSRWNLSLAQLCFLRMEAFSLYMYIYSVLAWSIFYGGMKHSYNDSHTSTYRKRNIASTNV